MCQTVFQHGSRRWLSVRQVVLFKYLPVSFRLESLKLYISEIKDGDFGDAKGGIEFQLTFPFLADIFTCAEFDESGDYLAAGDKSGRIYVFNGTGQARFL